MAVVEADTHSDRDASGPYVDPIKSASLKSFVVPVFPITAIENARDKRQRRQGDQCGPNSDPTHEHQARPTKRWRHGSSMTGLIESTGVHGWQPIPRPCEAESSPA